MPPFVPVHESDISISSHEDAFDLKTIATTSVLATAIHPPRQVSFSPMVMIVDVMSLSEYTPDEVKASWLNIDDMRRMRDEARSEAKLLDAGLLLPEKSRGLEHRTRDGLKRKRRNRKRAYAAVFCEIEFQREEEILDEDAIADAYYACSDPCAIAAQQIGERDVLEALGIDRDTKKSQFL